YPNPADDVINIEVFREKAKRVVLLDLLGREIMNTPVADNSIALSVNELPPGNYMLKVKFAYGEIVKRIVVNR
ncbi:MAG TPA: T9SS type A sorting domain-containing protein, partial [Chitinophagales bacterium]|nr:T9SS type A sorting domain-containing protein [Chitinophagales bacterium]